MLIVGRHLQLADAQVDTSVPDSVVLRPVMWMFIALLATFVITRVVTRRIRHRQRAVDLAASRGEQNGDTDSGMLGNLSLGGVHIHHQVFGILIMCAVGIALIAFSPEGAALNVCAVLFGVGVSLAFDEFALWLHLDDVYWSAQGRQSVDAIFCLLVIVGILIGGADFVTGAIGTAAWWSSIGVVMITLGFSVVALLKGKTMTGIIGVFFALAGVIGAIRLAKPTSWWARRRYAPASKKAGKSARRFGAAYEHRWNRLRDLVGGAPDLTPTQAAQASPLPDPLPRV
jgi:hypothetical protein